jgi:hypothetical protein
MRVTVPILYEAEFYETEEVAAAERHAELTGGRVYAWKTSGRENWLERGFSVVDVLGYLVLPAALDMPDDED